MYIQLKDPYIKQICWLQNRSSPEKKLLTDRELRFEQRKTLYIYCARKHADGSAFISLFSHKICPKEWHQKILHSFFF
jgi:hypothetical protein